MTWHSVKVDDDVFAKVQTSAEPLIDDFNSALRRLLDLEDDPNSRRKSRSLAGGSASLPQFPPRTPEALRQILSVIHLVRRGGLERPYATRAVAASLGVFPQTVLDKYTRQLGISAALFDELLVAAPPNELTDRLIRVFPGHRGEIESMLVRRP